MKSVCFVLIFLCLGAMLLLAQEADTPQALKRFDLTDDEIGRVREIQQAGGTKRREIGAELNIIRAEMDKLLLDVDVDMGAIEALLKKSFEWRLKGELAEIGRRVEMRKIFGEDSWRKFEAARRNRQQGGRDDQGRRDNDGGRRDNDGGKSGGDSPPPRRGRSGRSTWTAARWSRC